MSGEIDTFLNTRTKGDYWIKTFDMAIRSQKPRYVSHSYSIYMGISKKSPLARRAKEFGRHLKDMLDKGNIRMMVEKYLK
jgi:hypothetical protein